MLTDYAFTVFSPKMGEKVREFLEKRQYSKARAELEKTGPFLGHAQDEVALVRAIMAIGKTRYQEALNLVAVTLPYIALDRSMCALGHWIGAIALNGLGRTDDALYWCSLAADQAQSPAASRLQVGILCFWAEMSSKNGQFEQGIARARLALRRARQQHELFHVHLVTAHLYREIDPKKARYHLELAQNLAKTPERLRLITGTEVIPRPKLVTVKRGRIDITLLSGLALEVDHVRISAARSPRAILLLAYLVQNDGEAISEIAEQILPPDTAIKTLDKAKSDRAARVRQHLTQARRLLGDPAGLVCKGGRLWLSKEYDWESDLRLSVLSGTFNGTRVLPVLACPWLEELGFTLSSPSSF